MEVKWPYPGSRQDALATLEMRRALFKYHFSTSVVMWGLVCVTQKGEGGGSGGRARKLGKEMGREGRAVVNGCINDWYRRGAVTIG